jgi:hypothetical protein
MYFSLLSSNHLVDTEALLFRARSPSTIWRPTTSGLHHVSRLPDNILDNIPVVKHLLDTFGDRERISLVRLEPYTFYDWHQDRLRSVCINALLNEFEDSYSIFGRPTQVDKYEDIMRLKYTPGCLYLFNTKAWHCGVNYSPNPRYLLSASLGQQASFESALESAKQFAMGSLAQG